MECRGILVEVVDWAMLEAEVLRFAMARSEVLGSEVLRCVLVEAQEAMVTKEIWMRNDDRHSEAARLERLRQQDAQSGNEQIVVVCRCSRRARR
jgi:hypothetical protein